MMNYILRISKDPTAKGNYINDAAKYFASGFEGIIEHYAVEINQNPMLEIISAFLITIADFDGNKMTIKNKEEYYKYSFEKWKKLITEYSNIDLKTFSESEVPHEVSMGCWYALYEFNCVYNRFQGLLIDEIGENSLDLMTFDNFMRLQKNGDVWYIAEILYYHKPIYKATEH